MHAEILEKQKSKDTRIVFFCLEILCLVIAVLLIGVCGWYDTHYYNTLSCNVSSITSIDSTTSYRGSLHYFFQYDFKSKDCYNWQSYTAYISEYYDAVNERASLLEKLSITCYAVKDQDQCDVFVSPPNAANFWAGIVIGIILLFLSLICISATVYEFKWRRNALNSISF